MDRHPEMMPVFEETLRLLQVDIALMKKGISTEDDLGFLEVVRLVKLASDILAHLVEGYTKIITPSE